MKATNACIPCMLFQAHNTAVMCTADKQLQREILNEVMRRYTGIELDRTPGEHSQVAFEVCRELTGVQDPYAEAKRASNEAAMALYPELSQRLAASADPLRDALLLALAGNIIDLAIAKEYDLTADIVRQIERGFDVEELAGFRVAAEAARSILYLGDNAGEIVFDRLLIEALGPDRVTFVVKAGPIVNDAMLADAQQVGITGVCRVIDTGSNYFGFPWEHVSQSARDEFLKADMVISKGHANFETVTELGEAGDKVWYLLKAKCNEVARQLAAENGNVVLISHKTLRERGMVG